MTDEAIWTLRRAQGESDMAMCLAIRHQVFVREQCVDAALERDAIGTARVMPLDDRLKIQRMAVLREARGFGVGTALMGFMMADLAAAPEAEGRHFFLSSQVHAMSFYERLCFEVCSDVYMDAGIPHRDMRRDIAATA